MTDITTHTEENQENQVQILSNSTYQRAVQFGVELGHDLGRSGDYRLLTVTMDAKSIVLFEAVSGTDRYPPGRNMHVSLSAEEFDRLVVAVAAFRAEQEVQEARLRETLRTAMGRSDDYDPFLDDGDLP